MCSSTVCDKALLDFFWKERTKSACRNRYNWGKENCLITFLYLRGPLCFVLFYLGPRYNNEHQCMGSYFDEILLLILLAIFLIFCTMDGHHKGMLRLFSHSMKAILSNAKYHLAELSRKSKCSNCFSSFANDIVYREVLFLNKNWYVLHCWGF